MGFDLPSFDQFGINISLNYRNKQFHGTALGGCCTIVLFLLFWTFTVSMVGQVLFAPSYEVNSYIQYESFQDIEPFQSEGTASLGINLNDLHKGDALQNISRYAGLYFTERTSNEERTEVIFAPVPCRSVLPDASEDFWADFEASNEIPSNDLLCPNTTNFSLEINYKKLVAYVTTCADAIEKLGVGNPDTDCELDANTISAYLNQKLRVQAIWLAQNFQLSKEKDEGVLQFNFFERYDTIMQVDEDGTDLREYLIYLVSETQTEYFGSFLFNSYDWISRWTGKY